jgi:hypothetical protein
MKEHSGTRRIEMRHILIRAGQVQVTAELNVSRTADAIWSALPLSAAGNTWGDEIYFAIPVKLKEDNAQETVSLGDLGYWPPGHAFCMFFGPTPVSRGKEIRPASPVNVLGHIVGDPTVLKKVQDGEKVTLERGQEA